MVHQNWLPLLLQYLAVAALLYGATHLLVLIAPRRLNESLAMAATPEVRAKFQPYMEGLRGLLALNIFYIHCMEVYESHGGQMTFPRDVFNQQLGVMAVTYFFCMTGYLIWKGILEREGTFDGVRFLRGRFYRTFPAYAVVITAIFLLSFARQGWHFAEPPVKVALSYLAWLAFCIPGGPAINGIHTINDLGAGVMWTLQMDWVFYLAVPVLAWFAYKRGGALLIFCGAVLLYQPFLRLHFPANVAAHAPLLFSIWERLRILLMYMVSGFGLGILLAEVRQRWPVWRFAKTHWASALVVVNYFAICCFLKASWALWHALAAMPAFVLLTYGTDVFGFFSSRAALLLGRISYSLYLLHAYVTTVVLLLLARLLHWGPSTLGMLPFLGLMVVLGVLTIVVSFFSHSFIELPFSTLGRRRAASAVIGTPQRHTLQQTIAAMEEEAAQLPGQAEAELLLPQHGPKILR